MVGLRRGLTRFAVVCLVCGWKGRRVGRTVHRRCPECWISLRGWGNVVRQEEADAQADTGADTRGTAREGDL